MSRRSGTKDGTSGYSAIELVERISQSEPPAFVMAWIKRPRYWCVALSNAFIACNPAWAVCAIAFVIESEYLRFSSLVIFAF